MATAKLITIADGNRNDAAIWRIANNNTTNVLHVTNNYGVTTATTRYSDYFTPDNAASQSVGVLVMPMDGLTLSQTVTVDLMEGANVRATKTFNPSTDGLKKMKWFFVQWTAPYVYGNTAASTWRIRMSGTDAGGTFLLRAGSTTSTYGVRVVNANPSALYPVSGNGDYDIFICHAVLETQDATLDFGDTAVGTAAKMMVIDSGAYILRGSTLTASRQWTWRGDVYFVGIAPQLSVGLRCMAQHKQYWAWVGQTINSGQNKATLIAPLYDGMVRKLTPDTYEPLVGNVIFYQGDTEYEHELMTVQSYNPATFEITHTTNFTYTHRVDPVVVDSFRMIHTRNGTSGTNHNGFRFGTICTPADKSFLGIGLQIGFRLQRIGNPVSRCVDSADWRKHFSFLSADATAGQASFALQADLQLRTGDKVVLTSTQTTVTNWEQETMTILTYDTVTKSGTFNANLAYTHHHQPAGSPPRQTMVVVLSRNFIVDGENTNNRAIHFTSTDSGGGAPSRWQDGPYAGHWIYAVSQDCCVEFQQWIGSGATGSTAGWVAYAANLGLFDGCGFEMTASVGNNGNGAAYAAFMNCTSSVWNFAQQVLGGAPYASGFLDNCSGKQIASCHNTQVIRSCKAYGTNVTTAQQGGLVVAHHGVEIYTADSFGHRGNTYTHNFVCLSTFGHFEGCRSGFYNQQMTNVRSFGMYTTSWTGVVEAEFVDCESYDATTYGTIQGVLTRFRFQRLNGSDDNKVVSSNDQYQSLYALDSELCGTGYLDTTTINAKSCRKIRFNYAYGEDRSWQIAGLPGESIGVTLRLKRTASMNGGALYLKLIGAGLEGDQDNIDRITVQDVLTEQVASLIAIPTKRGMVTLSIEWRGTSTAGSFHDLYVGDIDVRQHSLKTGDLTIWDRGLPVALLVNSETTAKDFWDFTRDLIASDANSMGQVFLRALGLMGENVVWDNPVYDGNNNVTSIRMRIYDSKANAQAAGATGKIAEYTITDTYSALLRQTQQMVRE